MHYTALNRIVYIFIGHLVNVSNAKFYHFFRIASIKHILINKLHRGFNLETCFNVW